MSSQQDQIDLGPIFEPDPVQFQFETIGWYVLLALSILSLILVGIWFLRKYIKSAYRRKAVQLLQNIQSKFENDGDVGCITDVMVLLKQVSITTYGREKVAPLYGMEWLTFLDSTINNHSFVKYNGLVSQALYRNELTEADQVSAFFSTSKKWIRGHA
jgi:hypothetical protein